MENRIKTVLLLAGLTAFLIFMGKVIGGRQGMYLAFLLALAMNFFSYWFSDKIVLRAYGAKELTQQDSPELSSIVRELAGAAGIPMPRLYLVENDTPNAFATGRNPNHAAVAVTSGIMRICNREELKGVIGHELSHVINRDILTSSIAATLAGAIMMIASVARWGALFGGFGGRDGDDRCGFVELLVMAILAPVAASMIQLAISRTREYQADASGAKMAGQPYGLISALEKLGAYNKRIPMNIPPTTSALCIVAPLNARQMLSGLFSTHPPLADRIAALRSMTVTR